MAMEKILAILAPNGSYKTMDMKAMLDGLENLLEDRATPGDTTMGDDFLVNNYEVVIAGSSVRQGVMYITVRANDGTTKHFRLTEI